MACFTCGQQSTFVNSTPPPTIPQTCDKTKIEYQDILTQVETQLTSDSRYNLFISTIKSQINIYDQNCSLFQDYIETVIVSLLI